MSRVETNMPSSGDPGAMSIRGCPCCGEYSSTHWMRVCDRSQSGASGYELLHCPACSHVWLGNRPTPEEMRPY